jgi:hypothetical protein
LCWISSQLYIQHDIQKGNKTRNVELNYVPNVNQTPLLISTCWTESLLSIFVRTSKTSLIDRITCLYSFSPPPSAFPRGGVWSEFINEWCIIMITHHI